MRWTRPTMLDAIKAAHVEIKKMISFINGIVDEIGKPKKQFEVVDLDFDLLMRVRDKYLDDFKAAMDTDDKNVRDARLAPIRDRLVEEFGEEAGRRHHRAADVQDAEVRRPPLAAGRGASGWTAAASTRSVPSRPRSVCCPAPTAAGCSPAARHRC